MIKFESKEQVINALNSAELWLGVSKIRKIGFTLEWNALIILII